MRFGSPLDLLWLVPLFGGIVVLYLLRKRRELVVVPSLFLWERVVTTVRADTPWQKLVPTLLLFLQLLTAFLLVLALARPYLFARSPAGTAWVLIIDDGGRMNATDVAPSRLASAKDAAARFVASGLGPHDQAMVIAAGATPRLLAPLTSDRRQILAAIASVPATDTPTDLSAALTLARALLGRASSTAQAMVYSDGPATSDQGRQAIAAAPDLPARLVTVGTSDSQNVGIVALQARRDAVDPARGDQVLVSLRNFGAHSVNAGKLALSLSGHVLAERPLKLAANGGEQTEVFQSAAFNAGGVVTAALVGLLHDQLVADNGAAIVVPKAQARKVLLVTDGDLYLEKGLNVDPDVQLYEVAPKDFASVGQGGAGYDLVIFDDFLPSNLPPGRYLAFHAIDSQMPVQQAGADASAPGVLDWSRTDSLMRFVDLSALKLRAAAPCTAAGWGHVAAEADSGPLIVSGENAGVRVVWVAFAPADSNFPLQVSFPIFLSNALDWLMENTAQPLGSLSPGAPIALPHGGNWTVTRPGGSQDALTCSEAAGAACTYSGTLSAGVYVATQGTERQVYAVDMNSATESDLAPHPLAFAGAGSPASPARPAEAISRDLWTWAAAFALLLLMLEWLTYHRRL